MKLVHIDDQMQAQWVDLVWKASHLLATVIAEVVEVIQVSTPKESPNRPLYLRPDGATTDTPDASFGQVTPSQVPDAAEIERLLADRASTLFVVDVYFGASPGLADYGIRLARYLAQQGVREVQIMLLTSYPSEVTGAAQSGGNATWWTTVLRSDLEGETGPKKLRGYLQWMWQLVLEGQPALPDDAVASQPVAENAAISPLPVNFETFIASSPGMKPVCNSVLRCAAAKSTVLIFGESGTGKELVARAIHHNGITRDKPFVPVNCGAIPETLIASELFGHRKGSFTGATADRVGYFEAAGGGTLFLDEISTLPLQTQSMLLRVLEERVVVPVGNTRGRPVDVRIIAATNRDLREMVSQGQFREDLMYRLDVVKLELPPLRQRREDIPLLAHHFLRKYAGQMNKPVPGMTNGAMRALLGYGWPGNIRELENVIERAVIFADGHEIGVADLPFTTKRGGQAADEAKDTDDNQPAIDRQKPEAIATHDWDRALEVFMQFSGGGNTQRPALRRLLDAAATSPEKRYEAVAALWPLLAALCYRVHRELKMKAPSFDLFLVHVCGSHENLPRCMRDLVDVMKWSNALVIEPKGWLGWKDSPSLRRFRELLGELDGWHATHISQGR